MEVNITLNGFQTKRETVYSMATTDKFGAEDNLLVSTFCLLKLK